jgi:hypothetical protein
MTFVCTVTFVRSMLLSISLVHNFSASDPSDLSLNSSPRGLPYHLTQWKFLFP